MLPSLYIWADTSVLDSTVARHGCLHMSPLTKLTAISILQKVVLLTREPFPRSNFSNVFTKLITFCVTFTQRNLKYHDHLDNFCFKNDYYSSLNFILTYSLLNV